MIEFFHDIVDSDLTLTIFVTSSIKDIWKGRKYTPANSCFTDL